MILNIVGGFFGALIAFVWATLALCEDSFLDRINWTTRPPSDGSRRYLAYVAIVIGLVLLVISVVRVVRVIS